MHKIIFLFSRKPEKNLGFSSKFRKGLVTLNTGWLVGFVALRPKSTAMVIVGRSVHLTTLFPGQAQLSKRLTSNLCTYFRL